MKIKLHLAKLTKEVNQRMKRKVLLIGLVLVFVLSMLMPAPALAEGSSSIGYVDSYGVITGITVGNIWLPPGNDYWQVRDRVVSGTMSGNRISGDFTLEYKGKFNLLTQEGKLKGTLSMDDGSYLLSVKGISYPLEFVLVPTPWGDSWLPKLTIDGSWSFDEEDILGIDIVRSTGTFAAWLIFVPTEDGHVDLIVDSSFSLTGTFIYRPE